MSTSGLSRVRLGRMRDVMAGYVDRGEAPGLVALVARRGETHAFAIGCPRDTIFRISSLTKPTRRDDIAGTVGTFGWDGGLGTVWRCDPEEEMVTLLMTQRAWTSPDPPPVCRDFWTSAYAAIDD